MKKFRLSRRAVLRGAGSIAVALPWLECMEPERRATAQAAPTTAQRFISVYQPGGTVLDNTAVCYMNDLGDGQQHNWMDLPNIIAGGAGVLVLEELEHAKARGAKIYAEVAGYGATSDGYDMVAPSGEGAVRCMNMALENVKVPVDYINPHATSTPIGDIKEIEAIREVFGARCPPISATKSLTGHSLGATGVQEAIYSLLMMQSGFICESANIENLDPAFADIPIVRERKDNVALGCVLSNSFGFGGTNASIVFKRLDA